ncbi:hypothetical protein PAECIP111893_05073 [Paenibacillus plantiphilus]|uniref:DUF4025 domain-containing protein n=1 Tax=Paenibacillus plantiphilus TaxID=2905650 RepID=A0ABN8H6E7_9BACL|nr:hypothetical protein [Paenibacillus plantiphilus]CAH1224036.1 hypothetical protein PAECIP111893_05073 [Paenibacillus plantiphilus]
MSGVSSTPTGSNNDDRRHEGRDDYFMDIDRMVNEGLGGGQVTLHNGMIEATTTETMIPETGAIQTETEAQET